MRDIGSDDFREELLEKNIHFVEWLETADEQQEMVGEPTSGDTSALPC